MNTREGTTSSSLLGTVLIAMGMLVAAVVLAFNLASPKVAQGQTSGCENAEFRTGPSALLPGCRAYELVSPVDDPSGNPAGISTDQLPMPGRSSDEGDNVVYGAVSSIGDATSGVPNTFIFGKRTENGWDAEAAIRSANGEQLFGFSAGEPTGAWISSDARSLAFAIGQTLGDPNPLSGGQSIYRIEAGAGSVPEWLSQPGEGTVAVSVAKEIYASRDLSTVVISAPQLNAEDPPGGGIYAWRDGSREFVSEGKVANWSSVNAAHPMAFNSRNTVSADGKFVLFVPGSAASELPLYVRDLDAGVTHELAGPSTPALRLNGSGWYPSDPASGPSLSIYTAQDGFVFGAADAPVAYFRSRHNLTPEATGTGYNKMYRANLETGEVAFMPGLDGAPVAVSDYGSDVMFLRPSGSANDDPWELRHWSYDAPDTSSLLGSIPGANNASGMTRTFRSTDDGQTWLFLASGSLDPNNPNLKSNAHQAYRWEVGDDHPTCLSCDSTDDIARFFGANLGPTDSYSTESIRQPNGLSASSNVRKWQGAQPNRALSADGSIMAFDSPDRLLPQDTNNVRDVYLWDENEPEGKQLRLLTKGNGINPSYYVDMAPDGSNVFFTTQDGLVEADVDKTYDVYVAREGGGIAVQQDPGCSGDTCQGPTPEKPELAPSGSATYQGSGNPEKPRNEALLLLNEKVNRRAAAVRVKVNGAGRIVVSGKAIKRKALDVSEAGTYRLKAKLKKKAAKKLRKHKQLKTPLQVRFNGEDGSKSRKRARVVFKTKANKKRASNGARSGR